MRRLKNPAILLLLILMAALGVLNGEFRNPTDWLVGKLILLPGILIGISFHEFAHGFVSYKLGDPTPKREGRLTVNPLAHVDPFGFLALIFAGFGWGIPVRIDPSYYKHRKAGQIMVALSGVTTNFIVAVIFCFIIRGLLRLGPAWLFGRTGNVLLKTLFSVVSINIVLAVFNLLPVPPLDGFGVVTEIFGLRRYRWYYGVHRRGFLFLMILIIFNVTGRILSPIAGKIMNTLINTIIL